MKTNKKYWLRGLIIGTIVYVLFVAITYVIVAMCVAQDPNATVAGIAIIAVAYFFSPMIIAGLLFGIIYGHIKK